MADYFTSDHFKLLNKWKGQKRDSSSPEQNRAYEDLTRAYGVTEAWAEKLKSQLFPLGKVDVRKRPTNQGNNFTGYNWARIYPSSESPKELAYTIGIDASDGFVVKIDTVGMEDTDKTRRAYFALRGAYGNSSPFVALLPAQEGLGKTLDELVAWSAEAIRNFTMRYDEVVAKLNLDTAISDEDLLKHFDGKPEFRAFRASWSPAESTLFCRFARMIHGAGLDWWHVDMGVEVRFGRKEPGTDRAVGVVGYITGVKNRLVSWSARARRELRLEPEVLSSSFLSRMEKTLVSIQDNPLPWLSNDTHRAALWPDQLRDETADSELSNEAKGVDQGTAMNESINRIYYGPPGTGKTHKLSAMLKRDYEQAMTSISNEEWRSQFIAAKIANVKWWEGAVMALYDLGGKANVTQILEHPFIEAIADAKGRKESLRQTIWATLQERTVDESTTVKQKVRFSPQVFDKNDKSVWEFSGEWREACGGLAALVDEYRKGAPTSEVLRRYSFVTFHQSYGYEEFVEGLRPVLGNDADAGGIQYEIRAGTFKELCRRARSAPDQRFAMVIDEINRGNISKIFGELITLIEPDKREGAKNALSVTLPYSGELFSVPPNVYIIGSMNTADRSLALLDTALRRRFDFVPVYPDARDEFDAPLAGLRVNIAGHEINIPKLLDAINRRIEVLYDRDHCIGHSYFTGLEAFPDGAPRMAALEQTFRNRILPLLEEYFFEDWQKIRLVLADNQKTDALQFVLEGTQAEDDLTRLFGNNHELVNSTTARRFAINDNAFREPAAYIGIYASLSA